MMIMAWNGDFHVRSTTTATLCGGAPNSCVVLIHAHGRSAVGLGSGRPAGLQPSQADLLHCAGMSALKPPSDDIRVAGVLAFAK
jgi:hypothetical protein